jgi:predicted RNA-binding Zn-ribbon protein involved in translation (DUF1610 family)
VDAVDGDMKPEKLTKMKIPASHNKSGYVMRYFCPRCGGDMERCDFSALQGKPWDGKLQCGTCGYEENIGHFRKR